MPLKCLVNSPEWDSPIFKVLAHNDTGASAGHQGGVVIPIAIRNFFPGLTGQTSPANPTTDRRIAAHLFVENEFVGTANTRYQLQTWGGTRPAESRLTDELGPLRNSAQAGDVLIFQRNMELLDQYRLTLVRRTSSDYGAIAVLIGSRRWGNLTSTLPVTDEDLGLALTEEKSEEALPFKLFDPTAATVTSTVKKVARSLAFRTTILDLYGEQCAACGEAWRSPSGLVEVDAAHVVPRSEFGADEARNGVALCKKHHWAFDKGMFGVTDARTIVVPPAVQAIAQNAGLTSLHGKPIREASVSSLRIDPSALAWHRTNLLT